MFKLIKILNSGVGVPEPIRIPKASDAEISIGDALTLSGGYASHCSSAVFPIFVAAAPARAERDTDVLVYPVFDNMLFEAPVSASPESLAVGDKVTLYVGQNGAATGITASKSGGVATIVDLQGATNIGDIITVKFA